MMDKLLSALGLCKKAGKLVEGSDAVRAAAEKNRLSLILTARDLSQGSRKKVELTAQKKNIAILTIPVDMDDLWRQLGRRAGILGIADKGLAQMAQGIMARQDEEE